MAKIRRKVSSPTGYGVTDKEAEQVKQFAEATRLIQGTRVAVPTGNSGQATITLATPGKRLLGFTIIPEAGGDLSQTQVDVKVNNYNQLNGAAAIALDPHYTFGMIYFPVPAKLTGQDTLQVLFNKSNAGSVNCIINTFYLPQ